MAKQNKHQTENALQQQCYRYFHNNYPHLRGLLFAVPNGGSRTVIEAKIFKATGVVAGVSDMLLIFNGSVYCFELKTIIGKQSEKQLEWQERVEQQGINYFIIREFLEFKSIIDTILN